MEHGEQTAPKPAEPTPRVRFVALRGREPLTLLRFHPRITVLSGFGDGIGAWLSGAFARGPAGAPEGFVEIAGERVALSAVPAAVCEGGECPLIDAATIEHDLQLTANPTADLGSELEAIDAAIQNARRRQQMLAERVSVLDDEMARVETRVADLQATKAPARRNVLARDRSEDAAQLEQLLENLAVAAELPKAQDPAAEALARAFDALDHAARRHRNRDEIEEELRKWELVTREARSRLSERRATAPHIESSDLAEASRLREAIREAHDRRPRVLRKRAEDDITALEGELRALLDRLGARSYEDLMLLGTGLGSAATDLAIREATNVVAAAERRCAELQAELSQPDLDDLRSERQELVERAVSILGYDPGRDPARALREYRVEPQQYTDAQVALARKLRDLGARVDGTPEQTAQRLIDEWQATRAEHERGFAELQRLDDELSEQERVAREGRTMRARLTRELEQRSTEIEDLSFDRRRLAERLQQARPLSAGPVGAITPSIVDRAIATTLRRDGISAATLPIVIDNPLEIIAPEFRNRALDAIARSAGTAQIVIVTDDDAAVQWAHQVGDTVALAWTADGARGFMAERSARQASA
jgi:hypothetical protein